MCKAVLTEYFRKATVCSAAGAICNLYPEEPSYAYGNVLRGKLLTQFQIYTMCFVKVTLLLVFHCNSIHHRSLSHSVLSNHMGYPEDRTFSIPQNNFVFSNPVYKPCVIIQGFAIQYFTN